MKPRSSRKQRREDFEAIVHAYESRLLRYATRLTANPATAEDIVQESFLKLLRRWKDLMQPSPQMQAWLYRVVHNESVDHVRRETRRQRLHANHASGHAAHIDPEATAAEAMIGREADSDRAAAAAEALQSLSPREREMVILKVFEEKRYREIAEIMELSIGNVGYILHHAMRKLAERIQQSHESADPHTH